MAPRKRFRPGWNLPTHPRLFPSLPHRFPNWLLHRLDPRIKLIAILVLMIVALSARDFGPLATFAAFLLLVIALSRLSYRLVLSNLKPFVWLFAFTCGSSRLAGDGFKSLRPPFRVEVRGEPEQLPTSHTCFNELDLPPYASKAALASKLHIAIESGAGFGFV